MNRALLIALLAVFPIFSSPVYAWGFPHCVAAANLGTSSKTIAKHCSRFVPAKGLISYGVNKNKTWHSAFPHTTFGADIDHIEKRQVCGEHKFIYTWKVSRGADAMRTKKIKQDDWNSYKVGVGLKPTDAMIKLKKDACHEKNDTHIDSYSNDSRSSNAS